MAFNSLGFLAFFAAVCAALALTNIPAAKRALGDKLFGARHVLLIAANYVFYASWNWKCCFLLLALTVIAYVSAANCRRSRFALHAGVVLPLVILGVFKYFNFFVGSFCELFGLAEPGALKLLLPVGISFYTFQTLSYIIDVHRGKVEAERNPVKLALYISFFPQLVSGPIVKAGEFLPQLCEDRNVSLVNLEKGVQIFLFGLFKKVVIADNIAVFVNAVFLTPCSSAAERCCWPSWGTRYSSIATSPVIPTWPSAVRAALAMSCREISTCRISPAASRSSGSAGTSAFQRG